MEYQVIEPPFALNFQSLSKAQLETYRRWFHDSRAKRIEQLTGLLKQTVGYESWEPDLSPNSLEALGRWFEREVQTRSRTVDELQDLQSKLTFPIEVPEMELTDRTFSLAIDLGMYFGDVILKNLPGTYWDQPVKNKKFADYGQPVIMGFGTVPLNPVRIMVNTAYGISRQKPAKLRELFETWVRMKR